VQKIETSAALYAHAIAIEREATERYAELSERMLDLGNEAVATVFATLARLETEHLMALERRTEGVVLPQLAGSEYSWIGAPETAARELVFRLMTPHDALRIALGAEKRAQAFFERVLLSTPDPALRALAREMAAEEREHAALLTRMLESTPAPLGAALVFAKE
jgi:rubrerythrin